MNNNNYPFNLFLTKNIVSPIKNNGTKDIFDNISSINTLSILSIYNVEIKDFLKNTGINKLLNDIKKINILKNISEDIFDKNLKNIDIEKLCIELIKRKYILLNSKKNIEIYLKNYQNITNNKFNKFNKYENPINYKDIKTIGEDYFKKIIGNKNNNDYLISLDILLQGNYINLSLPSCGLITSILSNNIKGLNTYIELINILLNNDDIKYDITDKLPFRNLNMSETLTNILLDDGINNNDTKSIIKNIIDSIQIDLKDIFYQKGNVSNNYSKGSSKGSSNGSSNSSSNGLSNGSSNNSSNDINIKKLKLKKYYIIPFIIKKDSIVSMKKSDIDKIRDFKTLIKSNNDLLFFVLNDVYNESLSEEKQKKNLLKPYYKEVLACYLFNLIRIVYDICYDFLDKLDDNIKDITVGNKERFGKLNLEGVFNYTTLLKKSLYNFKLILLNNFYKLFLPTRTSKKEYGMDLDENECYRKEKDCKFTNDNNIFTKYPIKKYNKSTDEKFQLTIEFKNLFENFILNSESKYDLYDKSHLLEFGGYTFNNSIIKYNTKVLNKYFKILQLSNIFNLFIIQKIIGFFKDKKNIPIELVEDFKNLKDNLSNSSYSNSDKLKFELLNTYEELINKSKNYFMKYYTLKNKINSNKSIKNKEQYFLIFLIYYLKSYVLSNIVKKSTKDIQLKNELLIEMNNIKKKSEKILSNKLSI